MEWLEAWRASKYRKDCVAEFKTAQEANDCFPGAFDDVESGETINDYL